MPKITIEFLVSMQACSPQREYFVNLFPEGAEITPENVLTAAAKGLDVDWLLHHLLPYETHKEMQNICEGIETGTRTKVRAMREKITMSVFEEKYKEERKRLWEGAERSIAEVLAYYLAEEMKTRERSPSVSEGEEDSVLLRGAESQG